jgi:DNA-binding LacI/PurR family transcriptional regulator
MPIKDSKEGPSYSEAVEILRRLVVQMAGRRLPSERDLAAQLQISRPRLRSALAALQREGLVEPRQGSGTYAVDHSGIRLRQVALLIDADLKLGDDPFFSQLMESLQESLQAEGIRCLVARVEENGPFPPLEDGVLTLGLAGKAVIERLRPQDAPAVGLLLGTDTQPGRRASVFHLDDREAGREAARALIRSDCREIVFLGRPTIPASQERFLGVEEVALASGRSLRFVSSHLNYADGVRLGRELEFPHDSGLLGIVATNDWLAVGLQAGLHRRPMPVTRPIKIVSFDGLPVTSDPTLGIISLSVPIDVIARDAVAELRRLLQSPGSVGRAVCYSLHWAGFHNDRVG